MLKKVKSLAASSKVSLTVLASTAVLCCSVLDTAQAIPLSSIEKTIIFGDSLSDSGNYTNMVNAIGFGGFPAFPANKLPTFTTSFLPNTPANPIYTWSQWVVHDVMGTAFPTQPDGSDDDITNNLAGFNTSVGCNPPFLPFNFTGANQTPINAVLNGVDYAAGGSTTASNRGFGTCWAPSLKQQITQYRQDTTRADPRDVFFIWSGANDLLTALSTLAPPEVVQFLSTKAADDATTNIAHDIIKLSDHGAKRVVVFNMPNLAFAPQFNQAPLDTRANLKDLSVTFNGMLNQKLGWVKTKRSIKILYIDIFTLLDDVVAATDAGRSFSVGGQVFTFTNSEDPACGLLGPTIMTALICANGYQPNYIFADALHPSGEAHELVARYVEEQIRAWA